MKPLSLPDRNPRHSSLFPLTFASVVLILVWTGLVVTCRAAEELLPRPTGPHATGRVSFHWKDEAREELETRVVDDRRELMVHVFYPADPRAAGQRAVYLPDAEVMRGVWNEDQLVRLASLRAYSLENAALPAGTTRYPVLILAPGGGMKGLTYHVLVEDLASHGWIVAAIDPPYNARGVRFPDGRVLGNLPVAERGWPAPRSADEERRYYKERIVHWSHDISFVIDQLTALDRGTGPFARRLDLPRGVGVLGHSRGGQAAGAVRLFDERVRGGINLDGTAGDEAILQVKGADVNGEQPFLWIQKTLPPPPGPEQLQRAGRTRAEYDTEIERVLAAWHRQLGSVTRGAIRVYLTRPGIEHVDFSDEPFWDGRMTATTRPGKLQTIAETRLWVRGFFDGTVRGDWTALKKLTAENRETTETQVRLYGQLWP